jgi:hypothetical protein
VPQRAQLEARLASMERIVAEGGAADGDVADGDAAPAPDPVAEPAASSGPWMPGFIIAGVGAAAIVASVVTGVLVLDARGQLDQMCDAEGRCPDGFEGTRDEAAVLAGLTDGLLFGGLALAAVGVILAFVIVEGETEQARVACRFGSCAIEGRF